MDNKLACDRDVVVTVLCIKQNINMKEGSYKWATRNWTFSVVNCIGYQMISVDDHAM